MPLRWDLQLNESSQHYNDLLVENLRLFAVLPTIVSFEVLARRYFLGHMVQKLVAKTRVPGLRDGVNRMILRLVPACDGCTDGQVASKVAP